MTWLKDLHTLAAAQWSSLDAQDPEAPKTLAEYIADRAQNYVPGFRECTLGTKGHYLVGRIDTDSGPEMFRLQLWPEDPETDDGERKTA